MLRTISQIATICNVHPDRVRDVMRKEQIIPAADKPFRFDIYQQEYIFTILWMENRMEWVTIPSKLNDPNFDTTELYSRENFISCGYIIRK
jgi:hypothetical protein